MKKIPFPTTFLDECWSDLDEEVRRRLEQYAADLLRFNPVQNLVSRVDPPREIARLLEESVRAGLAAARFSPAGPWLDVGSGGGFPGLVLGCLEVGRPVTLVERRGGRCDFLRREVRALGLSSTTVVQGDVRDLVREGARFEVVFAKAVAEPGRIEGLCDAVVEDGGSLVLFQDALWAKTGEESPGGWIVQGDWYGGSGGPGRETEERRGYRLQRPG